MRRQVGADGTFLCAGNERRAGKLSVIRRLQAFLFAIVAAYLLAVLFYTQQVISKQAGLGAGYSVRQQAEAFYYNLVGLGPAYGVVLATALGLGFVAAAYLKGILKSLAPFAYPIAGAAAVFSAIWLIEHTAGAGGVGAIGGAKGVVGMTLQSTAGAIGGLVFGLLQRRGLSAT